MGTNYTLMWQTCIKLGGHSQIRGWKCSNNWKAVDTDTFTNVHRFAGCRKMVTSYEVYRLQRKMACLRSIIYTSTMNCSVQASLWRVFIVLEHPELLVGVLGVSQESLKPTRVVSSLRPEPCMGKILQSSEVIQLTHLAWENIVMLKSVSLIKKKRPHLLTRWIDREGDF